MKEIRLNIDGKEITAREGMTILDAARNAGIIIPTLCYHERLEPFGACRLCIVEVETRKSSTGVSPVEKSSTGVSPVEKSSTGVSPVEKSSTGVPPVEKSSTGVSPVEKSSTGVPPVEKSDTAAPLANPGGGGQAPPPQSDSRLVVSCVYTVENNLFVKTRSKKIDEIRKTILELLLAHAPDSPKLQELAAEYGADRNRFEKESSFCIHCGLCVRYCAEVKKKNAVGFIGRGISKEISFVPRLAAVECEACKECFSLCPTSYAQTAYVLMKSMVLPPTVSRPA